MKLNALIEYADKERLWLRVTKTDEGYTFTDGGKTYHLIDTSEKVIAPILKTVVGNEPPKIQYIKPKVRG